jgi:hypothetical protein
MPAPTTTAFKTFLKQNLLAKGFIKRAYVNGVLVETPTELPAHLEKQIDAEANGLHQEWVIWQATQTVSTPGVMSGTSVGTGTMP